MTEANITAQYREYAFPANGSPRLVYLHTDGGGFTEPDRRAPDDARERAICRALLQHALRLLDAAEAGAAAVDDDPPFDFV